MTEILPLTPGLLISMAYRMNHGFGVSFGFMGLVEDKPLCERQKDDIDEVWNEYVEAYNGISIQCQRLEECTGGGFYRPEKETGYCQMATPEALEYAKVLVKRFEDMQALTPSRPYQA